MGFPSAKWIIYGERGYEIGVLAIHQLEQMNKQLLKTWRTLDEIVLDWISVVFPNQNFLMILEKNLFEIIKLNNKFYIYLHVLCI